MSEGNGGQTANDEALKLKEQNDRLYAENIHNKKLLENYSKLGNPDDIRGRLEDYEGLRKTTAKTPEEIDRIIADKEKEFERRFGDKYSQFEQENQTLKSTIQQYEVVLPTMQKAASLFVDTSLELVEMLVRKDLISADGKIFVKDKDGKPLPSQKDPRQNMGVDEYLESIAAKHPSIAKARTIGTGKPEGNTSAASGFTGNLPTSAELFAMSAAEIKAKGYTPEQIKQIVG